LTKYAILQYLSFIFDTRHSKATNISFCLNFSKHYLKNRRWGIGVDAIYRVHHLKQHHSTGDHHQYFGSQVHCPNIGWLKYKPLMNAWFQWSSHLFFSKLPIARNANICEHVKYPDIYGFETENLGKLNYLLGFVYRLEIKLSSGHPNILLTFEHLIYNAKHQGKHTFSYIEIFSW